MHGGKETVSALASEIEVEANFGQILENPLQNLFNATSLHSFPYLVTKSFPGKCVTSLLWHSLLKINLMTKFQYFSSVNKDARNSDLSRKVNKSSAAPGVMISMKMRGHCIGECLGAVRRGFRGRPTSLGSLISP